MVREDQTFSRDLGLAGGIWGMLMTVLPLIATRCPEERWPGVQVIIHALGSATARLFSGCASAMPLNSRRRLSSVIFGPFGVARARGGGSKFQRNGSSPRAGGGGMSGDMECVGVGPWMPSRWHSPRGV